MRRRCVLLSAALVLSVSAEARVRPLRNCHEQSEDISIAQRIEGVRYRYRNVEINGATVFSRERINAIAGAKSKAICGADGIELVLERIKRAYLDRGHVLVKVEAEPKYGGGSSKRDDGWIDVTIRIGEGPVIRLRRMELVGNETTRDRIIRRRILQDEGQPYSLGLMEKSLRRINGLGRFEKLTMANVKTEVDENERVVDIVIFLKEKPPRRRSLN